VKHWGVPLSWNIAKGSSASSWDHGFNWPTTPTTVVNDGRETGAELAAVGTGAESAAAALVLAMAGDRSMQTVDSLF
jgi:hypothetical protein